jgi:hypothetical protein
MSKVVKRFVQDETNQKLWENNFTDASGVEKTIFSGAVDVTDKVMNYDTGFQNTERKIVWLKTTESAEALDALVDEHVKLVQKGILAPVRQFADQPIWDGHAEDVNPSTNEPLGRYSITKFAPKAKALELDRTYLSEEQVARLSKTAPAQPAEVADNVELTA